MRRTRINKGPLRLAANGKTMRMALDDVVVQIPFREIDIEKKVKVAGRAPFSHRLQLAMSGVCVPDRDNDGIETKIRPPTDRRFVRLAYVTKSGKHHDLGIARHSRDGISAAENRPECLTVQRPVGSRMIVNLRNRDPLGHSAPIGG
jgi:hypothetical protein